MRKSSSLSTGKRAHAAALKKGKLFRQKLARLSSPCKPALTPKGKNPRHQTIRCLYPTYQASKVSSVRIDSTDMSISLTAIATSAPEYNAS